ncbi:hypothetical protein [Nostoc sp. JL33]|uniref:hypothetical protein n=1 Tax=Nostoc sp. JL33 TaxID=2815396 RepID=UPI0025D04A65|nr:hypothetical protein [Nostoc sp. JL33]MBN3872467.1 hypothetical protein [Nostoc sp. JL33]
MLTDDTPQTCWVVLLTLPIFEISDKSIVISSNTARSPHLIQARMLPRSHTKKPSHLITGLSLSQSIIVGRVVSDYAAGCSRLTLTTLFFSSSDLGSVRFKMPSL